MAMASAGAHAYQGLSDRLERFREESLLGKVDDISGSMMTWGITLALAGAATWLLGTWIGNASQAALADEAATLNGVFGNVAAAQQQAITDATKILGGFTATSVRIPGLYVTVQWVDSSGNPVPDADYASAYTVTDSNGNPVSGSTAQPYTLARSGANGTPQGPTLVDATGAQRLGSPNPPVGSVVTVYIVNTGSEGYAKQIVPHTVVDADQFAATGGTSTELQFTVVVGGSGTLGSNSNIPPASGTTSTSDPLAAAWGFIAAGTTALSDLPKAVVAMPHILWDATVGLGGGAAAYVLNAVSPFLLIGGLLLFLVGAVLSDSAPRLIVKLRAAVDRAKRSRRNFQELEPDLREVNETNREREVVHALADDGTVPPSAVLVPPTVPVAPSPPPIPAVEVVVPAPDPIRTPIEPTPTAEVERQLGEPEAEEPTAEEIRSMEEERRRTLVEEEEPDEEGKPEVSGYDRMLEADERFKEAESASAAG